MKMKERLEQGKISKERRDAMLGIIEENEFATRYNKSFLDEWYTRRSLRRMNKKIIRIGIWRAFVYIATLRFIWGKKNF